MGRLNAPVNWTQQMRNFIESYPLDKQEINSDTDLAHAVQKDAVQNSLDAIDPANSQDFNVTFAIDNITEPNYLTITDSGTTGLTGRPSLTRSELERLSEEQYREERWSRMQALGYSHPEFGDEIGARGQGKFIFIGSSENGEMIFDTLRDDGVYRVGQWKTKENKPLMKPKEGRKAKAYVKECGLDPLEDVGTRIIIPDPKTEVWKSFWGLENEERCDLYRYISSTWWEALHNGRSITIKVEDEGIEVNVEIPKLYQHYRDDPDYFENLSREGVGKPLQDDFSGCLIKELVIAYSEKEVPDELKGIALQRGEMTVERFDPTHGNPHLPNDLFRNHVFGWIILNKEGDRELKKTERASHYHLGRKKGSLAFKLFGRDGWLARKVDEFGKQLGYAAGGREIAGTSKTLTLANRVARNIAGYEKPTLSGGKREKEPAPRKKKKKRRMKPQVKVKYPTKGSRRVEFGEKVSNIKVRVANYADSPMDYELKMTLNKKKGLRKKDEKEKLILVNKEGTVKDKTDWFGNQTIRFDEDYEEGKYVISAVSQSPEGKFKRETRKLIYLNIDPPPGGGIFKEITADTFEYPENKLQYRYSIGKDKRMTVILNDAHPLYDLNAKKSGGDPNRNYQLECAMNALLEYDFKGKARIADNRDLDPIKKLMDENTELFETSVGETSKARQRLLFDAFKKR